MQDMSTRELLRGLHLLPAHDAQVVILVEFLCRYLWESVIQWLDSSLRQRTVTLPLIHVRSGHLVPVEGCHALLNRVKCEIDIPDDVQRQAIIHHDDRKEYEVHSKLADVRHEFQMEQEGSFPLPLHLTL